MKLSSIQTLVNYRRRDITESFISDTEIREYANEALRKIHADYEFAYTKTSAFFSYTTGGTYKLSSIASDFDEPINLFYGSTYEFIPVSPQEFYQLSAYNYNIWAIDNADLLVKTSFGTGTLILNYYSNYVAQTSGGSPLANLSATTDSPLMAENDQDIIVDFVAARCFQKEGMVDDYKIAYNDFLNALKRMKNKTPSRKKHYNKIMTSPRKASNLNLADKSSF